MSTLQLTIDPPKRAPLRIRLDRAITLRAVAIAVVVLYHAFTVAYGSAATAADTIATQAGAVARGLMPLLLAVLSMLDRFVIIFFVVAGYFAYRAYQRSRCAHTRRSRRRFVTFFIWRRFWRLVPVFWVALLFSYFVSFDHPFTWDGLRKLAVNASLLKTLYPGYFFSINHAHWYVAVQWQLDLLYPLFLFIVARRSAGFAVAVAWLASIVFTFVVPQFTDAAFIRYLPFRWWAEWSLGVYLAHRHLAGARLFPRPSATILLATLAFGLGRLGEVRVVEWLAVRVLLAAVFECLLLSHSPRHAWERRLAVLGACSYSLYLLHIPIQQLVLHAVRAVGLEVGGIGTWLAFAVVSGGLALALAKVCADRVENRSAAFGNRLWRRRALLRRQVLLWNACAVSALAWFGRGRKAKEGAQVAAG